MFMVSIPRQQQTGKTAEIAIDDAAPPDIKDAAKAFIKAANADPRTLQRALRNGTALASPQRVIAAAELGNSADQKLDRARNILARFFELRADWWVEYDPETEKAIQAGIENVDTDVARSWRIDTYLGRIGIAPDGQSSDIPPPNQHPFNAAA
jgi:hypothetical protein